MEILGLEHLNGIDYGIVGIILISVLIGVVRGFVRESLSLLTWVIAIILAIAFAEPVAEWFTIVSVPIIRLILAIILLVLATLILGGILSYLVGRLIHSTRFSITDRIIGTVFGFARGSFIVALIILIGSSTYISQKSFWHESELIPKFEPMTVWIKEKIPDNFMDSMKTLMAEDKNIAIPNKNVNIPKEVQGSNLIHEEITPP